MHIVKVAAAAAFLVAAGAGASFAGQADGACSCITAGPAMGQVGSVVSANGDVVTSGAKNFEAAKSGVPLSVGSEISVGAKSSAQISVGSCTLPLMANSVTRVNAQKDGNICVASVQTSTSEYGALIGNDDDRDRSWVPFALFGGSVGAAALLILTDDDKDPVAAPVSP